MSSDMNFHWTRGNVASDEQRTEGNLYVYASVPYTPENLSRYAAIINHGGIGIVYSAMNAAVPQLVWPQAHDQFDNAARVAHGGWGVWTSGKPQQIVAHLRKVIGNDAMKRRCQIMQSHIQRSSPEVVFKNEIEKTFG
ncbi:MAG: glycosyltransferase [Thermoguttaceae bacterium]